jgi:hypothetical protein
MPILQSPRTVTWFLRIYNTTDGNCGQLQDRWNDHCPNINSVFYWLVYEVNTNTESTYVAYCFAEVEGFSKFGSYTGNGSADGPFVYTGFRPAFVL